MEYPYIVFHKQFEFSDQIDACEYPTVQINYKAELNIFCILFFKVMTHE